MQGTTAPGLRGNGLAGRGFAAGSVEMRSEQRTQLLDAVMVEFSEHGYEEMSVPRAMAAAGVSAAEFQAEFADLDACLFAGYEQLTNRLTEATRRACEAGYEWPQRVRLGLQALLAELVAQPAGPRGLTRSFPALGRDAHERYESFVEGFAPMLAEGRRFAQSPAELPGEVEMLAVGAAETIVVEEVEAGRGSGLPELGPQILFSVLVPFLGPEAAAAEMRAAS